MGSVEFVLLVIFSVNCVVLSDVFIFNPNFLFRQELGFCIDARPVFSRYLKFCFLNFKGLVRTVVHGLIYERDLCHL